MFLQHWPLLRPVWRLVSSPFLVSHFQEFSLGFSVTRRLGLEELTEENYEPMLKSPYPTTWERASR